MTDISQKLQPPLYRNLALNPSGEAAIGATWTSTNGGLDVGKTPAPTTPLIGTGVVQYTVTRGTSQAYAITPLGPPDAVHHGAFEIPPSHFVSASVFLRSPDALWAVLHAVYLVWDSKTKTFTQVSHAALSAPLHCDDTWRQLKARAAAYDGATHWLLRVNLSASDPTVAGVVPPLPGSRMWVDKAFVPDSGVDLTGVAYVDGDQSGCEWEGVPHYSTSRTSDTAPDVPTPDTPVTGSVDETDPASGHDPPPTTVTADTTTPGPDVPALPGPPLETPAITPLGPNLAVVAESIIKTVGGEGQFCMSADVQVGDLLLNTVDAAGVVWVVSELENWWTLPEPDIDDIARGGFDGSYPVSGRYQARVVNLVGSFFPQHKDQIRNARDRLIRAANACRSGTWLLTHEFDRTLGSEVWLSGAPQITTVNVRGRTDFSIGFRAPDPVKYGIEGRVPPGYNYLELVSRTDDAPGRPYPRTYPWKYPEAVFGMVDQIAANDGNWAVYPTLTLHGPTYGPVDIINRTTEQQMRVTLQLYPSEVLVIDCATKLVTLNGVPNMRFYLEMDTDWLRLDPGGNALYFLQEEGTGDRSGLTVQWRSGWIG